MKLDKLSDDALEARKKVLRTCKFVIVLGCLGFPSLLTFVLMLVLGIMSYRRVKRCKKRCGDFAMNSGASIVVAGAVTLVCGFGFEVFDDFEEMIRVPFGWAVLAFEACVISSGIALAHHGAKLKREIKKCRKERQSLLTHHPAASRPQIAVVPATAPEDVPSHPPPAYPNLFVINPYGQIVSNPL